MSNLNVLAVDDELGIRTGISRLIGNFNIRVPEIDETFTFTVDTAETGSEAFEKVNTLKPDLILLDYKLPDTTGIEILQQLKLKEEETLVIMITAFATLDTAVSAIKSGAFDFLAKPFTPDELRKVVTKAAKTLVTARQMKKLNEERKQIRYQLISVLGHELKSPLGAIEGYLFMMRDKIVGENISNYEKMVERCLLRTDHMRKLISDILEMTKIESGNRERVFTNINMVEFINHSIEHLKEEAEKNQVTVEFSAPSEFIFRADVFEMGIIVNNLLSNAVRYNKPGGKVSVTLSGEKGNLKLVVADTGVGLSKEDISRLFTEFVRIKNPKTKDIFGSGVGLSTLKKVVELYHGTVTVNSIPDEGSEFIVNIFEDEETKSNGIISS